MAYVPAPPPGPDDVVFAGNAYCRLYGEFSPGTNTLVAIRCDNNLGGEASFTLYDKKGRVLASRTFPPYATTREELHPTFNLGDDRELGNNFNIGASLPIP